MHKRISANNFRMINLETQYPPLELFTFRVALHVNIKKKLLACKTVQKKWLKQLRTHEIIICCDHVNKCFKYSQKLQRNLDLQTNH